MIYQRMHVPFYISLSSKMVCFSFQKSYQKRIEQRGSYTTTSRVLEAH